MENNQQYHYKTQNTLICGCCKSSKLVVQRCNIVCIWDFNHKFINRLKHMDCKYTNVKCHRLHVKRVNDIVNQKIHFKLSFDTESEYLGEITHIQSSPNNFKNYLLILRVEATREIGKKYWKADYIGEKEMDLKNIEILQFVQYSIEIRVNI